MWDLIVSVPDHCLSFYFACNQYSHIILDKFVFRPHLSILSYSPLSAGKCGHDSTFIFDQIFVKLAGNQDRHKISEE